jgi:hypothetical protein
MLYRMPRQQTTNGVRALGRLALVDHHRGITRRLEAELRECSRVEGLQQATRQSGLPVRSTVPRVYVVAGLAGGTGGGMFLDVAYLVRQLLRDLGQPQAEVVGLFLLPQGRGEKLRTPELANAYAALAELNHYGSFGSTFQARYDTTEPGSTP